MDSSTLDNFLHSMRQRNDCQWEIEKDLQPATITSRNLPVKDKDGNCYCSCVFDSNHPPSHTEKVINRKLKEDKVDRKKFDLYTYLAPCYKCIEGGWDKETAELESFAGVYYSWKPRGETVTFGKQVGKNAFVIKHPKSGLAAIKETTKVTLSNVKDAINNGKDAKISKQEIIDGVKGDYQKNAVKSYLDQHPLN